MMRTVALAVAGWFLVAGGAAAQPVPAIPAIPVPLPGEPADPAGLPGGAAVSRPLQPVEAVPEPPRAKAEPPQPVPPRPPEPPWPVVEDPGAEPDRDPGPRKILGGTWGSDEILFWWAKGHPVPALVTGGRDGPPALGRPGTTVLLGNRPIETPDAAGYRLTHGFSLDRGDRVGFEGTYFFLGSRTVSDFATNVTNPRFPYIGLPFVNAQTGLEDVLTLARPGQSDALAHLYTTTRVQGAEANLIGNLVARPGVKVNAIAGYRFLQVNEGLRVETRWMQYPTAESGFFRTLGMTADQFDGRNEFHGGQLGLSGDFHRGPFYVEVVGKVAFGTNFQVVNISGETHLITAANPAPVFRSYFGGVYSQPTNLGRVTQTVFAVVPEGTLKVGLKTGERGRFYVGYNFLYMNTAVRPGDQIDRTVNPSLISSLNPGGPLLGPDRPRLAVSTTDFWVQGLVIGFEHRF